MLRSSVAILILTSLNLVAMTQAKPAAAAGLKIALVAPTQGPFALLGKQMLEGAQFQAQDRGSEIITIDETCEASDGAALAKAVVAAGAEAAIGFLCTESLEAVLPALAESAIPALSLSVRSDILMEDALRMKWPFFRLVPSAKAEAAKITDVILSRWKDEPLALIDDGTINGRELVESVREALAGIGLTPVFNDTYRPAQEQQVALVRRLAKSGATHVFTGGDRIDTAIIARDARSESLNLTLMGGEALNAADQSVPLENGVLAVTLPDYATLPETRPVSDAMKAAGLVVEGYVLPAFAAVSLLEQAKDQAATDSTGLLEGFSKGPYPTVLGPIRFDTGHELADNPYQLMQWQNGRFVPVPSAQPAN
ncbi:branched-chain amino acid ABC transporter substrate-binding protein [Pararhizobium antarcticum]|uniref:Amino acid ABC transporter n=1 Tax=Pararhizobium antarcticum TaxID=1798805 RepID=A0A657LPS5_9HYPH|nr:branched-chain amino acid ABC transporter substrate-binding protein [Pararhizobium antarcticum]OJF93361.1 amino acid ABC transporter [Pararhizobium antarcticum]OJF96003.1 amino acid ABC transporter [Rhizobium sp. 58]